ncbi:hypothetical protein PG985_008040 [Apiospora marii]|uniref:uncharacterized protein n=1 Tax=Apiospora marii TaxID=335849 RepID=UPI00312FC374
MPYGKMSESTQAALISKFGQISQLPDQFAQGESSSPGIKREVSAEQETYDWDGKKNRAIAKARDLGVIELPANQVAQLIDQGTVTRLIHNNQTGEKRYSFFLWDSLDVLACIQNSEMEAAIYDIAAHCYGQALGWAHPNDHALEVSRVQMTGVYSGSYVFKVSCPKTYPTRMKQTARAA